MFNLVTGLLNRFEKGLRAVRESRAHASYIKNGRKPWIAGYHVEKTNVIRSAINDVSWDIKEIPKGYGCRLDERVVEYPWFFAQLPSGAGNLWDAGSVLNFDYAVTHPKVREKNLSISTLGPESHAFWDRGVSYIYEDLRHTCFRDEYFDWVCSLSTIEHIGLDNRRFIPGDEARLESDPESCFQAVSEFRRVLKPGGSLFLTMPFGRAKNHGWFQIFDSLMVDRVIEVFCPIKASESIYQYAAEGWYCSSRERAADATFFDIHVRSDYDEDYAAGSRAVVCLELIK